MDLSSKSYKNWILFIACLSSALVPFMGSSLNPALPQIGRESGLHSVELSWVLTSYLLSTAILQVPFGRLADIWGKRDIFIIGLALFTVSTLPCGFATNAIMGSVDKKHYSMASPTTGTVRLTGQSLSMGITTMIIAVIIGKQVITPELNAELMRVIQITFAFFALFCAFGAYTSMAGGNNTLHDNV